MTWMSRRRANDELRSRIDPEATLISRQSFRLYLAYKAHLAVAGKGGQVITVAVATTGAAAVERSPWREVDIEYRSRSG